MFRSHGNSSHGNNKTNQNKIAKEQDAAQNKPRSRSPIHGKRQTTSDIADEQTIEGEKKEEQTSMKYTGRPGEKKFNGRCRLFVACLANSTTEDELRKLFNEFGETGEVFVNKDKGFGFIRMDYRHNTEIAKLSIDKKSINGRNIQVRYATHASAIELHGLDNYASNDFVEKAMTTFGPVERCVVVCDDRGKSKGYAIVEFVWKKSAAKVIERLKDEMFVLGRIPKPVFAKPLILSDEDEGIHEEAIERMEGLEEERSHEPRFISPNSFEYTWAKRWRDLFIEEQDKKAKLEQETMAARSNLEFEMEAAIRQQETSRIREELARRQEELQRMSEDMMMRQDADRRILERSRQRELAAMQGHPEPPPRNEQELHNSEIQLSRENAARQNDFVNLRQRVEMTLQNETFKNNDGKGPIDNQIGGMRGTRSEMMGAGGFGHQQYGSHHGYGHPGTQQQNTGWDYQNQQQSGPPGVVRQREMQQREMRQMQQRGKQQRGMEGPGMEGQGLPPRDQIARNTQPRGVPAREIPPACDVSARELVVEAPPKDNPAEGKSMVSSAARSLLDVDTSSMRTKPK